METKEERIAKLKEEVMDEINKTEASFEEILEVNKVTKSKTSADDLVKEYKELNL